MCRGGGEVRTRPKRKCVFWEGFPCLSCPLTDTMQETQKKHTLYIANKHIKENTRKEEMQNYIPIRNEALEQTLALVSPDPRLRKIA